MRHNTAGFIIANILLFALCASAGAEVRSGFWTLLQPGRDSADFSSFDPLCGSLTTTNICPIVEKDFYFRNNALMAPYGAFYDSAAGARIQSLYLDGKTVTSDREGLFYLDSMMKNFGLKAPRTGYADSIGAIYSTFSKTGVYYIKSSENRYGALIKIDWYIGGIDRVFFYWAYQPDTGVGLSKKELFEVPASLRVYLDVFSGRPNPTFTLTDPAGIAEIVHEIFISITTLLDSSIIRTDTARCPSRLGYRGMSVSGMFMPESPISSFMPSIDICSGMLVYHKSVSAGSTEKRLFDKGSRLEKNIIRVCCKNHLRSTDSTVSFCDLVPDSLKATAMAVGGQPGRGAGKSAFQVKPAPKGILYCVNTPGPVGIELFNVRGGLTAHVVEKVNEPGTFRTAFHNRQFSPGIYLVKCSRPGTGEREVVVPLVVR